MSKSELAKESCSVFVSILRLKNAKEASQAYDEWASNYDKHCAADEFEKIGKEVARLCGKYVKNSEETTLLDVGAGTGRVADNLRREENFKGIIDILDGSMGMLYKASKKNLACRCIIQHLVEGDIPLPEQSYDAVVSSGAFAPNHLPVQTVEACLKLIKPNGILIVTNEITADKKFADDFETFTGNMVQAKRMGLLESFEVEITFGYTFRLYVFQRCAEK